MARIRITDHEDFAGDYRAITTDQMKLGTQMELQYQSNWSNKEMAVHLKQGASLTPALLFATLWQAGKHPTWEAVLNLSNGQLRFVREAGDPAREDGADDEPDPTQAPKASPRGDDAEPEAAPSQP